MREEAEGVGVGLVVAAVVQALHPTHRLGMGKGKQAHFRRE